MDIKPAGGRVLSNQTRMDLIITALTANQNCRVLGCRIKSLKHITIISRKPMWMLRLPISSLHPSTRRTVPIASN